MAQIVTYTPPPTKLPDQIVEVPDGWELVYPEPRDPKIDERFLGFSLGVHRDNVHNCVVMPDTKACVAHPVIGYKRFIVRPAFQPKFGDIIHLCEEGCITWVNRVYCRKDENGRHLFFQFKGEHSNFKHGESVGLGIVAEMKPLD